MAKVTISRAKRWTTDRPIRLNKVNEYGGIIFHALGIWARYMQAIGREDARDVCIQARLEIFGDPPPQQMEKSLEEEPLGYELDQAINGK